MNKLISTDARTDLRTDTYTYDRIAEETVAAARAGAERIYANLTDGARAILAADAERTARKMADIFRRPLTK